jgi:molybdate/tungstate transport system substrate-binding protein
VRLSFWILAPLLAGCAERAQPKPRPPITVFAAASLARPLKLLADSFQQRTGGVAHVELGGSLEQSRKITELGRIPDVLLLIDEDVVTPLVPTHLDWYVRFATNRLAVAYTPRSKHADSITAGNWWKILSRKDVAVGRADPNVAPVGRQALSLVRRAEPYYKQRGLADRVLQRASLKYVRPNATELAALLETGEVDYIIDYESIAGQYGFNFVPLPEDLSIAVLYTVSVPRQASHFQGGVDFVAFVLSEDGKRILREAHLNVLSMPVAVGSSVPIEISEIVRTVSAAARSFTN